MISVHKCFNLLVHNVFWAMREELKEDRFEGGLTEEEKHWASTLDGVVGWRGSQRRAASSDRRVAGTIVVEMSDF